ncbi:DNA mismatch repair protein MutS2 [Lachnospiraceae bacterium NE2001]|nr:DNA mismatch repair protein MutS2 [Lachnospiraceae bacterium NE2001]
MNKRSIRVLEYGKILEQLESHAVTLGAKRMVQRLKPLRDRAEIEALQQNTRDAFLRLERHGSVSFSGVTNVTESLRLLEIDSALSAAELLDIASLLEAAAEVKSYGDSAGADNEKSFDSLTTLFEMLIPLEDISSEIRRCIISSDEIADDASGNLKSIRRKITESEANLHNTLNKIIKSSANRDMLMDALVTTRNGRYCIPVKIEYKNAFPGMVHDRSQTGSTVFIEPMQVVELNNTIQDLHSEELMEIEKILSDLSRMAAPVREDIRDDYRTLVNLDFIFAKAKYAKALNASEPVFNDEGIVELKAAIHPLLDQKTAVPIDLALGKDYTLLIVTGPNTGGKTVSLKTLGLLTLMGQSGLHIPALAGSRLAIFDDVFADIGDEQSIELSLSTFSSHMSNIIFIVKHANEKSLVLFDEPGGGTDPAEGAALAISILNDLKAKGARVMATTHYTELKTYAIGTEGVENASCEFDIKSLAPTYKLMIGIPGSSNAFAIAKRLGMPDEITNAARDGMDENQLNMERIISQLEENEKEMSRLKEELEIQTNSAAQIRARLADKEKTLDEKKAEILDKARIEAREIVEDAKDTADAAIRDYNKWLKNPHAADARVMEQTRSELRKKKDSYNVKEEKKKKKYSGHKLTDFHIGDKVLVLSLDTEGHIIGLPDSKGLLEVEMGILTSRHPADDLLIIDEDKIKTKNAAEQFRMASVGPGVAYTFRPEINLLGKTVDDAVQALDKYLDEALLAHAEQVTIIHGKGTGVLRRGITEYLKKKKFVKEFRSGEFGEGDAGVTIVKL